MQTFRWVRVGLVLVGTVLGSIAPGASVAASTAPKSTVLCKQAPSYEANVAIDCNEPDSPHNETAVAINPRNSRNLVVGVNDYQEPSPTKRMMLSRAHVSFDGGHRWLDVALPYPTECTFTGDPTLAFDATGTVYYASLCEDTGSILVTRSRSGGVVWDPMVVVAQGSGTVGNDHPVLAAWGRGNVIVTWVRYGYTDASQGQITAAPVLAVTSHDGARSFGAAQVVSGTSDQCTGLAAAHACDQTWGNAVTVASDGAVLATFYNTSQYRPDGSTNLGRNTHLAMRLDPQTGGLAAGPYVIGLAYDGINEGDFPVNVNGRQTLHDSEFRILMQGNIAADPTDPKHVAVVWFDDRNAKLPVSPDPYQAQTDADVIVSQSFDQGTTWSAPTAIREAGDQFFPWAAYDGQGLLHIGYMDRFYDPANHQYGYTVASETGHGSLDFHRTQVSTALSDSTRDNRWSVTSKSPSFPNASRFIGDYSGIAVGKTALVAVWTDQRRQSCLFGTCGNGEDTYVATLGLAQLK